MSVVAPSCVLLVPYHQGRRGRVQGGGGHDVRGELGPGVLGGIRSELGRCAQGRIHDELGQGPQLARATILLAHRLSPLTRHRPARALHYFAAHVLQCFALLCCMACDGVCPSVASFTHAGKEEIEGQA